LPFFLRIQIVQIVIEIAIITHAIIPIIHPYERRGYVGSFRFSIFGGKAVGAKPISFELKFKTV
jgi:hypothetical protein